MLAVRLGFKPSAVRPELYFLDPAFGGSATDTAPMLATRPAKQSKNNEIMDAFSQLDPEAKKLVLMLMRKLAGAGKAQ